MAHRWSVAWKPSFRLASHGSAPSRRMDRGCQVLWKEAARRSFGGIAASTLTTFTNRTAVVSTARRTLAAAVRPHLASRRPRINGKAVAFHVKDLVAPRPWPTLSSSPSLLPSSLLPSVYPPSSSSSTTTNNNNNNDKPQYDSNLIVVLDMDECLIHSQFMCSTNRHLAHQLRRRHRSPDTRRKSQTQQAQQAQTVESFRVVLPDGDLVHVNVRPGLEHFLHAVTSRFETHIYTAAMEVYAKPVLDQLDPHGKLAGRWYREHCQYDTQMGAYVKALGTLPPLQGIGGTAEDYPQQHTPTTNTTGTARRGVTLLGAPSQGPPLAQGHASSAPLHRVVLVDNNPLSFLANPENGILVSSFYNDPTDTTLPAVWDLLQELDEHDDVRPHLTKQFGLEEALRQQLRSRQSQSHQPHQR